MARPPSALYRATRFGRRHRTSVILGVTAFVALVGFAVWQSIQSERLAVAVERARGSESAAIAHGRLAIARERLRLDPTAALAFARSSLELAPSESGLATARRAIARGPIRRELGLAPDGGEPRAIDVSADGLRLAVGWTHQDTTTVSVIDTRTWNQRLHRSGLGTPVDVTLDGTGRYLIAAIVDRGFRVWNCDTGEVVIDHELEIGFEVNSVHRLSDRDRVLACALSALGELIWYEIDLDERSVSILGPSADATPIRMARHPAVTADGRLVVDPIGARVMVQRVEDLGRTSARELFTMDAPVQWVALGKEDTWIAAGDRSGRIDIWSLDLDAPRRHRTWMGDPETKAGIFDPFGPRLALLSRTDNTVRVHSLDRPASYLPMRLDDTIANPLDLAFLPDGSVLLARTGFGISHWESIAQPAFAVPARIRYPFVLRGFPPRGDARLVWQGDQILRLPLEPRLFASIDTLATVPAYVSTVLERVFFDPEAKVAALRAGLPPRTTLVDLEDGRARTMDRDTSFSTTIALSPSGRRAIVRRSVDPSQAYRYMAGFRLRSDTSNRLDLVDVATGGVLREGVLDLPRAHYLNMAMPDDRTLLVARQGALLRYDLETAEAAPDTVWSIDTPANGLLLTENARSMLFVDAELWHWWVDPWDGRKVRLYQAPNAQVTYREADPTGTYAVFASWWWPEAILVEIATGTRWRIPAESNGFGHCLGVGFDPRGRWLVTEDAEGMKFWDLPPHPSLREQSHESLIPILDELTNIVVVPDSIAGTVMDLSSTVRDGYRLSVRQ